jgi:Uma2 family endonuclease
MTTLLAKSRSKIKLGPHDHGRKMSLKAFEFAEVEDGYTFELQRGYVVVSEVANYLHAAQVFVLLRALFGYDASHVGLIHMMLTNMDCKLLIPELDSERHPDIAVYLTKPKGKKDRTLWRNWFPELTIEVVSEGSRDRDYIDKREEYWLLGVKEYWIVDAKLDQIVILKRGKSDWIEKTLGPDGVIETKVLPGFKLACKAVLDAGKDQDDAK